MAFDDIPEDRFDEHDECKRYAATLEAENAKLRDLLRRVLAIDRDFSTCDEAVYALEDICPEIKSAIEPTGDAGELEKS